MSDSCIPCLLWTCSIFLRILRVGLILILMFVEKTTYVGDCCRLTFFECGFSTAVDSFLDDNNAQNLEYNYSVNELLFYLTKVFFMLREKDADSHCPILVTIEPPDMSDQEEIFLDRLVKEAEGRCTEGRAEG